MAAIKKQILALVVLISLLGVLLVSADGPCSYIRIPYFRSREKKDMKDKCYECCSDLRVVWSYNLITRKCSCKASHNYIEAKQYGG